MNTKETFERNLNETANELEEFAKNCDPAGLLDYLHDSLEVEVKTDSEDNFIGAEILVMVGGPTVWVDTVEGAVMASWNGFSTTSRELSTEICELVNFVISEFFF